MKFATCSLAIGDEYKQTIKWCIQSQEVHAARHGYTRITDETVYDSSRAFSWSKIKLLQKYLTDYDFLVWMDADVLITNPDIRLEVFLAMIKPDAFMFIGHDFQNLNAGILILRNCAQAHEFLEDVWNKTEYVDHIWWEQAAIIELQKTPKYNPGIQILPHTHINILNAFHHQISPQVHWLPGDFCIHFAGIHDKGILEQIQQLYAQNASRDPSGKERIKNYMRKIL